MDFAVLPEALKGKRKPTSNTLGFTQLDTSPS